MAHQQMLIPHHLQNLIDEILKELNVKDNHKLVVRQPIKPGENWLGNILQIEVVTKKYNKNVVELNVIAKLAPNEKLYRDVFPIRSSFEREIYTYKTILPEFINIQKESNIKNIFAPFVKCYRTLLDETQEVLVLENMTEHSYKSVNNRHPVDYQHASVIMTALGKLHALSFALKNKKPELFMEIGTNTEDTFYKSHFRKPFLKLTQNIGKQVLEHLNKNGEVYSSFERFIKDPSFVVDKIVTSELAGKYSVICHGDPQTRNILFKYGNELETNTPTSLCLIDWQLCKLGSPCLDIAFFIWTCTDKNFRDCYYEELIETYYNSLSSFLIQLGECSEKSYPKSVFKEHLKTYSIFGLMVSLWVVLTHTTELENLPDVNSADSSDSLIDMLSTVSNDAYFARMIDVVEDIVKWGYDM